VTIRFILGLLAVVMCAAFTCNAQTQPSAVPTEQSLRNQCDQLLAAKGYVATAQASVWDRTVNGITESWQVSGITVIPPPKAGEPYYGFIMLDQYDSSQHGRFTEGFRWQESTNTWVPLTPGVVTTP
jgi:hypothetical protein